MELSDRLVTLGLSSCNSDLRKELNEKFSNQCEEWNYWDQEWTVSAYLTRNLEFRINSKDHGSRRGEI